MFALHALLGFPPNKHGFLQNGHDLNGTKSVQYLTGNISISPFDSAINIHNQKSFKNLTVECFGYRIPECMVI